MWIQEAPKVELTDRDQCDTRSGEKFQGVKITLLGQDVATFLNQEMWDALNPEEKEAAVHFLVGTFESCIAGWIATWVDVITHAPELEHPFGKKVEAK